MPTLIEPQTVIHLLANVGIVDYSNQRYLPTQKKQEEYFLTKIAHTFNNFRYIRQNHSIYVNMPYVDLLAEGVDYAMFKNANFESNWVYCFVTSLNYVNDSTTEVVLEVDAWQTFCYLCDFGKCMIVRSHVDDVRGKYTFPEGLETGDYVITHTTNHKIGFDSVLVGSSVDLSEDFGTVKNPEIHASTGTKLEDVQTGLNYYYTTNIRHIFNKLKDRPWISQNILFAIQVPSSLMKVAKLTALDGFTSVYKVENFETDPITAWINISDFTQYFPRYKNKKLYSYPYSFIEVSSNTGSVIILKPELMNDELRIGMYPVLGSKPRIVFAPTNYANQNDNGMTISGNMIYGEGLSMSLVNDLFPEIAMVSDMSLLYEAQNANTTQLANNIAEYNKMESLYMGAIEGGASAVSNLLRGNITGAVGSLYGGAKSIYEGQKNNEIMVRKNLAKIKDSQLVSPNVANLAGGNYFNTKYNINGLTIKWKTIKQEYANKIDEYFTRYGYLLNIIDEPYKYLRGNIYFNYIQTDGCIVRAGIPTEYAKIIEGMFDNGVTLWHNTATEIGDYTVNPRS